MKTCKTCKTKTSCKKANKCLKTDKDQKGLASKLVEGSY